MPNVRGGRPEVSSLRTPGNLRWTFPLSRQLNDDQRRILATHRRLLEHQGVPKVPLIAHLAVDLLARLLSLFPAPNIRTISSTNPPDSPKTDASIKLLRSLSFCHCSVHPSFHHTLPLTFPYSPIPARQHLLSLSTSHTIKLLHLVGPSKPVLIARDSNRKWITNFTKE